MFTWDESPANQHHRELGVEVSGWGDRSSKNAQYSVQPSAEPANVVRFDAPAGPLTLYLPLGTWQGLLQNRPRIGQLSLPMSSLGDLNFADVFNHSNRFDALDQKDAPTRIPLKATSALRESGAAVAASTDR
jgi:hypothetical protein